MANRVAGFSIIALFVFLSSASVFADGRESVGAIETFSGSVELKEPGATGGSVLVCETWVDKGVYAGDTIRTFEDSSVKINIEGSLITVKSLSTVVFSKTDDGLFVADLRSGEVKAEFATGNVRVTVLGNTVYGKGSTCAVAVEEGREVTFTAVDGRPRVDNRLGVLLQIPERQSVVATFDPAKEYYVFKAGATNQIPFGFEPKGERPFKVTPEEQVSVSADGIFRKEKVLRGPSELEKIALEKPPWTPKFHMAAVLHSKYYEYYDSTASSWYYPAGRDEFGISRAALFVESKYEYASLTVSLDANKDNVLDDLYVTLSCPKREELLRLKIGQQLVPFGLQPQTYLEDILTLDYSQAVMYGFCAKQGDPTTTDLDYLWDFGATLQGSYGIAKNTTLLYAAGVFNGEKRNTGESNEHKTPVGRLGVTMSGLPAKGSVSIGGSYYEGRIDSGASQYTRRRRGLDLSADFSPLTVRGEYIFCEDNPSGSTEYNVTEGWYVETGFSLGYITKTLNGLQVIGRVDVLDPPRDLPVTLKYRKSNKYVAGLLYKLSENVRLGAVWEHLDQGQKRYQNPAGVEEKKADDSVIGQILVSF